MALDIRRGKRSLGEKLVPSVFGAKLHELLHKMKSLEVLLNRVWHGIGSLGPVSGIMMNNFSEVKVGQAVNIASIVYTAHGIDENHDVSFNLKRKSHELSQNQPTRKPEIGSILRDHFETRSN
ncbi:hypothetical protein M436DRAFT_80413 [Aureobasidium namibiae CBS 147.97]|uniref:Uncharacterized protein n=1 Tax=Aureobasidium namibiae CBS 147.97 TaxID=1043004 RepID=A0A074WP98_9PEZI|nr:uncharacterized protein M436DRAFT_80413 [Aureobasidium namibiae CBS 147.97]KEQ74960.1 hypothetical protein M436DRAFT_80413 [Aureobasidium namibiae CBS 147.97]